MTVKPPETPFLGVFNWSAEPTPPTSLSEIFETEKLEMTSWISACATNDIEAEEVTRFDHGGRTFAIYHSPEDEYFATDGLCTHEKVHLADGLVLGDTIECPKHNAAFNYKTGQVLRAPACINLRVYPVKVEGGQIFIKI